MYPLRFNPDRSLACNSGPALAISTIVSGPIDSIILLNLYASHELDVNNFLISNLCSSDFSKNSSKNQLIS